jgi:hypothetical protein
VGHAAHMRVEKCIQHFAWKVWRKDRTWKNKV